MALGDEHGRAQIDLRRPGFVALTRPAALERTSNSRYAALMKRTPKTPKPSATPPLFPTLTKAQRAWVVARRAELKAAIDEGIASGAKDGYRAFDADRILAFIEQRRANRSLRRAKRA